MREITNISLAVLMVFLFAIPKYSIASKNLLDSSKKQTGSHFSPENLDSMIIAQQKRGSRGRSFGQQGQRMQRRGGPRGMKQRMQRRGGPQGQMMPPGGGQAPKGEGGDSMASDMQTDQNTDGVFPEGQSSNGGTKFRRNRKKMRSKIRQRMQRRGGPKGNLQGRGQVRGSGRGKRGLSGRPAIGNTQANP